MKFKGNGIFWNKETNKALVEFENGTFETTDQDIINKLIEAGYTPEIEKDPAVNETVKPAIVEAANVPEPVNVPDEPKKPSVKSAKGGRK